MATARQSSPGRRTWLVLGVAALGGVIGGVVLERTGSHVGVPSFVAPPAAGDLVTDRAPPPTRAPRVAPPAEAPAPIAALAGLPAYPGASPRSLGSDIVAAGMPMAVAWFTTPDPPEDVIAFYRNALKETHPHVVSTWASKTTAYVGWRDEKTEELHGVVVRREGSETMVLPSVVAPGRRQITTQQVPTSLPQPTGAERTVVVSMASSQKGVTESSVITTVPLANVRTLAEFYRKGFTDKGWHVGQVLVNIGDFGRVTATREGMRAEAYLRHVDGGDDGPRVEVYILLTTRNHA